MTEPVETESSPELKDRVARFMSRAEEVLEHPLAGTISDIGLMVRLDPETGRVVRADFDPKLQDKNSWGHLATLLRPLIFLTTDQGSVGRLLNIMKRDHPRLRQHGLEELQKAINAWRTQPLIAVQDLGPTEENAQPTDGNTTRAWTGEPGTAPEDFDVSGLTPDFELAEVYFYGRMWHADADKVDRWDEASPMMRSLMVKCAEVRTLSAVQWVRHLHDWIVDARAAGWPL